MASENTEVPTPRIHLKKTHKHLFQTSKGAFCSCNLDFRFLPLHGVYLYMSPIYFSKESEYNIYINSSLNYSLHLRIQI